MKNATIGCSLLLAAALAGCGGTAHPSASSPPSAPAASAPAAASIPGTSPNQGLCQLAATQVQVDDSDPATAQMATLDLLNAGLQHGISSPALKALVSAWALAVSTDLNSGEPPSTDSGPALQQVVQACASIGVTVPTG